MTNSGDGTIFAQEINYRCRYMVPQDLLQSHEIGSGILAVRTEASPSRWIQRMDTCA